MTREAQASFAAQLPAARRAARRTAAALVAACLDTGTTPARLAKVADRAIEDASRLQGLANLVSKSRAA